MTSCSDILGVLSHERLLDLADRYAKGPLDGVARGELATALGKETGSQLLTMLADLDAPEIDHICGSLDIDLEDLVRLATPPTTRGDCEDGLRPCPYRKCRHLVDGRAAETACALDFAGESGMSQQDISKLFGVTRQRIEQIEVQALHQFNINARRLKLHVLPSDLGLGGTESGRAPTSSPAERIQGLG